MRIGEKVSVKTDNDGVISVLNGVRGTIVGEKISDSHIGMLSGKSKWIVEFDDPVKIYGETLTTCEFRENEIELI